eukprot:7674891-Karenia_brevis.AAC.1
MFDADSQSTDDHASPELFDASVQTDQLQCGHLSLDVGCQTGDLVYLGAGHAPPELIDASSQTSITILKTLPDLFYEIGVDGHPSP